MDIGALVRLLFRRFYIALPVLVQAALLSYAVTSEIQPTYEVTSAVLFVGPAIEEIETEIGDSTLEAINPLLNLSGALGQVSQAIGLTIDSQQTRATFESQGLETSYEVGVDSNSPIMQFRVEAETKDVAASTIERLMVLVVEGLADRQSPYDVDDTDLISVQPLSANNEPLPNYTSRRRAQLLLAGSSVLFTIMVTAGADALLRRRSERRASRSVESALSEMSIVGDDPAEYRPEIVRATND